MAANKLSDVSIEQEFSWTGLSSSSSRTRTTMIEQDSPADPEAVLNDLVLWKVLSYALDEDDDNYLGLLLVNNEWNKVVTVLEPPTIRHLAHINRNFEMNGTRFDMESLEVLDQFFDQLIADDSTLFRKPSNAGLMGQQYQPQLALPSLQPQFHIAVKRFVHSAQAQGMMAALIAVAQAAVFYFTTESVLNMWGLFDLEKESEMDLQARLKKLLLLWEKWTSGVILIDTIATGELANWRTINVPGQGTPLDLLEWIGKVGLPTDTPADRALLSKVFTTIDSLKGLPWPSLEVVNDSDEANETEAPAHQAEGTADVPIQEVEEDAGEEVDAGTNEEPGTKASYTPEEAAKIEEAIAAIQHAFSALEEPMVPALQKANQEHETLVASPKTDKNENDMAVTITVVEDKVFMLPFDHHFIKSSTFLSTLQLMPGDKIKLKVDPKTMKTAMAFYDLDLVDPYDGKSRNFLDGDFDEAVGAAYARLVKDLSFQEVNDLKGLAQFFTLNELQDLCENALKLPANQEQVRRIMSARFPGVEELMRRRLPPGATLINSHWSMG